MSILDELWKIITGSGSQTANAPTVQKQPRPLFSGNEGRLNVGKPSGSDFFGSSGITGQLGTGSAPSDLFGSGEGVLQVGNPSDPKVDPFDTSLVDNKNARGGTHSPSPDRTFNIFGHTVSIPQNMMIPVVLGIGVVIFVLVRR